MAVSVYDPRSLGQQSGLSTLNDNFFSWSWFFEPFVGNSKSMDRVSSSSSSSSSSSAERTSSLDSYSRSSSGISFGKDYVPDKSEMKRVFDKFDENKDGKICGGDLHRFMGRLGTNMSLEQAKAMLKCVDDSSDSCVDFEDFYSLFLSLSADDGAADETEAAAAAGAEDTLLEVFMVFDRNGDGVITAQELQEVLIRLGIPEGKNIRNCERMIKKVASDGDNKIDITEFKSMMCSDFQNFC